jgi:hypothetical protein
MKSIYVLTAHDGNSDSFISTNHYSNLDAATGSFEALKQHLCQKYSIDPSNVVKWTFTDGGAHRTDIIAGRFNVSLIKWNVTKEVSSFI